MTLILRDPDVRALTSFPAAVDVVARGVVSAPRSEAVAERSIVRFGSGWLRVMSGTLPDEDVFGLKAFQLVSGCGVRYLIVLYRLSSGEPLAQLDGNYLTSARTSAAAAAAAAHHFRGGSIRVGVIGSGTLARDGLRALASVVELAGVRVYSRSPANRESYAAELGAELALDVAPAGSPAEATADAEMVLCATQTGGEVALEAADAGPAPYISSVSSTLPIQRELDGRIIASAARVVIDTRDALRESGDLVAAAEEGLDEARVVLLSDYLQDRGGSESPVVYKSIGSVEQDLALAAAIWAEAERTGTGERAAAVEAPRF